MRRATALNLVILSGGLTLFGTAALVSEQRRAAACARARENHLEDSDPNCRHASGSSGSSYHGGYYAGRSSGIGGSGSSGGFFGFGESGSVARGGFGGFGRGGSGE